MLPRRYRFPESDEGEAAPTSSRCFYGWTVVWPILVVGQTSTFFGTSSGIAFIVDHIMDDLSLSRSQVSLAYAIGTCAGAVAQDVATRWNVSFSRSKAYVAKKPGSKTPRRPGGAPRIDAELEQALATMVEQLNTMDFTAFTEDVKGAADAMINRTAFEQLYAKGVTDKWYRRFLLCNCDYNCDCNCNCSGEKRSGLRPYIPVLVSTLAHAYLRRSCTLEAQTYLKVCLNSRIGEPRHRNGQSVSSRGLHEPGTSAAHGFLFTSHFAGARSRSTRPPSASRRSSPSTTL